MRAQRYIIGLALALGLSAPASAQQRVTVDGIGGVAVSTGSGVTGTGVQRVDVATDATITTSIVSMAADIDTMVTGLAVDSVHDQAVTDSGPPLMVEAKDFDGTALPNVVTAEGDAVRVAGSLYGIPYTMLTNEDGSKSPIVEEDVASAAADLLLKVGAIRDDTLGAASGTEGDWEMLHLNANGALWTIDVNSASALTALQLIDDAQTGDTIHYRTSTGATEDEHEVKATAGRLFSVAFTNTNAAVRYWRCSNLTAANTTPGTSTVLLGLAIPGSATGAGVVYDMGPNGVAFSTALTCWFVTGAADSDVAEVAANEIKAIYTYK